MNKVRKCIYFGLSLLMICSVTACSSDQTHELQKRNKGYIQKIE